MYLLWIMTYNTSSNFHYSNAKFIATTFIFQCSMWKEANCDAKMKVQTNGDLLAKPNLFLKKH